MCDSKGVITKHRKDLNKYKLKHAIDSDITTLLQAMKKADIFIGVSKKDILSEEMILSMNEHPAIFAMANPHPEIKPELVAKYLGEKKYIIATGRSDYPNQINNVLAFPFIFRGALDVQAKTITMNMKIAAANSLAAIAREKTLCPKVKKIYGDLTFGPNYLIPTPFDSRIKKRVSKSVACTAIEEGIARKTSLKYLNF
jgi:malate dehydrogenase (oxaloacetate-decarboxylating)/malate dehydrogenase (oxaloacetate-decarboxylating)(NADP+)